MNQRSRPLKRRAGVSAQARRVLRAYATRLFPDAPPAVTNELISMLFASMGSVFVLGASICAIGVLLAIATGDLAIASLSGLILLTTLGRMSLVVAYRVRKPVGDPAESLRRWEARYAMGSYFISLLIGLFNLRALMLQDSIINMLVVGILFGYGSGLVTRLAVRPKICLISMALTAVPTAYGLFAYVEADRALSNAAATLALALIVAVFTVVGLQMMRYNYASTLGQLIARRDLSRIARRDALTGLPNRVLLRERFESEIEALGRTQNLLALHYLDLDHFKAVNDTHGHQVGDALLKEVSNRLKATVRTGDTAARLSGDEFVVVQPGIHSAAEAEGLAVRLLEALRQPYAIGDVVLTVSATLGIALSPQDGCDLDQLAARADAALYQAKREGRGSWSFWTNSLLQAA